MSLSLMMAGQSFLAFLNKFGIKDLNSVLSLFFTQRAS